VVSHKVHIEADEQLTQPVNVALQATQALFDKYYSVLLQVLHTVVEEQLVQLMRLLIQGTQSPFVVES
jgi:hypothetical protein